MKQEQVQEQKQTTEQKIKEKTKELIQNINSFKYLEHNFKKTTIRLCNELIDLHRIKNPDYNFTNLLQEKDLMDYSDIIETYVPYDISPMVTKLYTEGKLSNTDLMVLANTEKEFQQPEKQRKLVEGILTKRINSRELIRATQNQIREMIGEETNEMEEEEKILLECIYGIESIVHNIQKHNGSFKKLLNKKNKQKLIDNFYHLKNAIQFGLKIKLK